MSRPTHGIALAVLFCGAVSLACGGGNGGPNPVPTSISVTPTGPLILASGATQQLTAVVLDADGTPMPGVSVTWQSGAAAVAAVSATGNLTAALVGTAGITAHAGTIVSNPVQITVTPGPAVSLSVVPHAVVIDSGSSTGSLWTAQDASGNPTMLGISFTSRGAGATIATTGVVTGRQRGNTIVVASLPGVATDSIDLLVAVPGAPVLGTDLTSFGVTAGATLDVTLLLDMRSSGEKLGSTIVQLTWNPAQLSYQGDADAGNGLGATVNPDSAGGTLLLAAASANGLPGQVALRRITFKAAPGAGVTGVLQLLTTEVRTAVTFRDFLSRTVAGSNPLVTQ